MDTQQILAEVARLLIPGQNAIAVRGALGVVADVWLYVLLLFALIVLSMQPEGSLGAVLLMAAVILSIFIDKVHAFDVVPELQLLGQGHLCSLGTLLARVIMFVFPLIVAGISSNSKSRPPAIIGGLLAGAYLFALWFFEMNRICTPLPRDVSWFLSPDFDLAQVAQLVLVIV